jgi:Rod binding domain-containing protein
LINPVSGSSIETAAANGTGPAHTDPAKLRDAAQQFEALLIGQILRTERESGNGWMGCGDSANDCATEYAEQQFGTLLAQQGGLGLGKLIAEGLESAPAAIKDSSSPAHS